MHPARLPVEELLAVCEEKRLRRSGPGGQHRNKVETAVVLTHKPTGIQAEANERRSQQQNRRVAITRLRRRLAVEHREPADPAGPSGLWSGRLSGGRISVNYEHEDFPALLSEALDQIAASGWSESEAAERLGLSRSQMIRFLQKEPAAFALLNLQRSELGLNPLK